MAVLLMTLPPGARLPSGKHTVDVIPLARARSGGQTTSSGSIPSASSRRARSRARRSLASHSSSTSSHVRPVIVTRVAVEEPAATKVQHHLGHAAGQEDAHRHVVRGAVRQRIDEAGHGPVDACASPRRSVDADRRRARSPGCGAEGSSSLRMRRAPASRSRWPCPSGPSSSVRPDCHCSWTACGRAPRDVEPDRLARRCERCVRHREPERLRHHLRGGRRTEELAAAARSRAGVASEVGCLLERDDADARIALRASARRRRPRRVAAAASRRRGSTAPASSRNDATAIIIAGRPLSHVPTPITPSRFGRLRTSLRRTSAASLR